MSRPWPEALKLGDTGERLAEETLLPQLFPGARISRLKTENQRWLHADFLVVSRRKYLVEVKYDTYNTGNLALETKLVYQSGQVVPGWLYRTKADFVLYILAAFKEAYLLPIDELRLFAHQHEFPVKSTMVHGTKAYFFLVPRDRLPFRGVAYGTERQESKADSGTL